MQCIRPLKASLDNNGNITFDQKKAEKGLIGFELECRKCLACRLNQSKEKAIRAMHEAKLHSENIFLTLTYDDKNLKSPQLQYEDYVLFMKRLRKSLPYHQKIDRMVTGEYGEDNKRPHWHAIIFNYFPKDATKLYQTKKQEQVYHSKRLEKIWGKGKTEFGSVTMDSAGYVARYAAKKLVHGKDNEHKYHPIHKTPSLRGMGRSWIEKYYKHTFENGFIILNGKQHKIPRYYVTWAKKHQPEIYNYYVTQVQPQIILQAELKSRKEEVEFLSNLITYKGGTSFPLTRKKVKETILKLKFKQLQENLKL